MSDAPNRGVMIVLAYLWPLALVPFFLEKRDQEVQWHARHGLLLMGVEAVIAAAFVALGIVLSVAALWLGSVLIVAAVVFWFVVFGVHALAAIKGLGGSRLVLPGISPLVDRFTTR
jgi:uncharacterized membrane protein